MTKLPGFQQENRFSLVKLAESHDSGSPGPNPSGRVAGSQDGQRCSPSDGGETPLSSQETRSPK